MNRPGSGRGTAPGRVFDSSGGIVSTVYTDSDGSVTRAQTSHVIGKVIKHNANLRDDGDGWNKDRSMRRYASVDKVWLRGKLNEAGIHIRDFMRNPKAYSKWFSRIVSENPKFLTANPGTRYTPVSKVYGLDSVISEGRKMGGKDGA